MHIAILLALIVLVPTALIILTLSLPVAGARLVSYVAFPLLLVGLVFARSVLERGRS